MPELFAGWGLVVGCWGVGSRLGLGVGAGAGGRIRGRYGTKHYHT